MILDTAPQNEAILSNVGAVGEFRIRNSAKAFNILSSGLYANKIRAVIRELSCNAVDSHVAAGKADVPFTVHLPSMFEPWFSVRDYGTGLDDEQVTNIYTTYFESTKTNSNAFIGALGLGSKSPFSYTDNFAVTAIKDEVKRIYSAFINDQGVPSIAKMSEEPTTEENGVEIKFSVNDNRYDFSKFIDESRIVYRHFKLRPKIVGVSNFIFSEVEYETKDIIPGVHASTRGYGSSSVAIMGNIAYPIDIPNAEKTLGNLTKLLMCGLIMEFEIGELDFQASREGLSYIPQTINSIKAKLEAVNAQLAIHLTNEANKIDNEWERSAFLYTKEKNILWAGAVKKYIDDTKFQLFSYGSGFSYARLFKFDLKVEELANKYNVALVGIRTNSSQVCSTIKTQYVASDKKTADGIFIHDEIISVPVLKSTEFIINDTKVGITERVKYNKRLSGAFSGAETYIINPVDKKNKIDLKGFFAAIHNPPADKIINGSTLAVKERAEANRMSKNVTILKMEKRGGYHSNSDRYVWREGGTMIDFDDTKTYYYIPLAAFKPLFDKIIMGASDLKHSMQDSGIKEFQIDVYGVRKSDIEFVKTKANWINLETYIDSVIKKFDSKIINSIISKFLDKSRIMEYNVKTISSNIKDIHSPARTLLKEFSTLDSSVDHYFLRNIIETFDKEKVVEMNKAIEVYKKLFNEFDERYPMIRKLSKYSANELDVFEYINVVDKAKGI